MSLLQCMSLLLAQRPRHPRIEYSVGLGCTADMDGRAASATSVEYAR